MKGVNLYWIKMKPLPGIIIIYFIILLLLAPTTLLSFDTYYYWDWSRHLDFSYFDGSPMIAYFIKLSTLLFGDTLFALSFVGITSAAITSWIIYKTARLFLLKEASYIAVALWLFSPLMTSDILKQTTYDTPLVLFWALTIYFTVKFIKFNKTKELYWIGIAIGLMMLSKYSGVVLVLALLIFLLTTPYRYLFKTRHLYWILLLGILIFSPVIIWNEQHQWQSFAYQLVSHQLPGMVNPFFAMIKFFFENFIPSLNFMLVPPLLCWLKKAYKPGLVAKNSTLFERDNIECNAMIVRLCLVVCTTVFLFYLFTAAKASIRIYWITPYLVTSALLGGFCFQNYSYRKSTRVLIAVYLIASLCILIDSSYRFNITNPPKLIYYHLIQKLNASYPQLPKTVITPGWFEARMLFFLKNKPQVYSIDCGSDQNQYALWSAEIIKKIEDKTLKEVLYVDIYNRINCVEKRFDTCVRLPLPSYSYKNKTYAIYAYRCTNNPKNQDPQFLTWYRVFLPPPGNFSIQPFASKSARCLVAVALLTFATF